MHAFAALKTNFMPPPRVNHKIRGLHLSGVKEKKRYTVYYWPHRIIDTRMVEINASAAKLE
ncbi:Protein of unknown function [Pyronema omphalodes CBS 100304]|uniref:Uncharacterized protein n=1 Tax=Pyronema omphalodes (strain CBS 100304) TaxID=1076935 RepID=U4L536_PYROM|nr:Protein of unknown function [Pyronema omphalodes CBS 100304]